MEHPDTKTARRFISDGTTRVIFGAGMVALVPSEFRGQGKVMLVSSPGRRELVDDMAWRLGEQVAGVFDGAEPHVPLAVAETARAMARDLGAKWVLACGGGTAIGVAKAVALEEEVMVGAIPTTYAGSEMTDIWGITDQGRKTTGKSPRVRPSLVVYDPELTIGLPKAVSIASLFNALGHAAETLYAEDAAPSVRELATESAGAIARAIRGVARDPRDLSARTEALYGAHLAASCLSSASMGLHHKLCHVLGGTLGTAHAETHTVMLPYVLAYNAPAAASAMDALGGALATREPPAFVRELAESVGAPTALGPLGVSAPDLGRVVEEVMSVPYANPRAVDAISLRAMLEDALEGRPPRAVS